MPQQVVLQTNQSLHGAGTALKRHDLKLEKNAKLRKKNNSLITLFSRDSTRLDSLLNTWDTISVSRFVSLCFVGFHFVILLFLQW